MPTVSVIIPLYNKQECISRTIDSILAQSYSDFEIIVVDDGSTDKGPDIVSKYKDSRIRMIRQNNAGPAAARNLGTSLSRSPYVTYLDADDEWLPDFLQKCIEKLVTYSDCVAAITSYYIGPEKFNRWDQLRKYGCKQGPWRLSNNISQRQLNYSLAVFHACSTVYRRCVVEKYNGFYAKDNCKYGEDVYLWLQIMFNHKLYLISEPLAWYHCENSQLGLSCKKRFYPIEPCLLDVKPLEKNCPAQFRNLLQRWLANHALRAAFLHTELGNIESVNYLLKTFPLIKKWRWQYFKLKFKLKFPQLVPLIRNFKEIAKPAKANN